MDSMNVMLGGMLVLSTILISKLFCGYVCPIGTFSEGLSKLGKRFRIPKYDIGGIPDILLRSLKYILLFITFYFTIGSDELFCKNYDPYFATFTLFGADVSTWMATTAIAMLVVGAVFFRHLWCRYLCPLGAISNAFKYFYVFVVVAVIFLILGRTEFKLSTVIILASITILAYVLEIIGLRKGAGLQILRITRNVESCTECGLCDRKCPQGIKISKMKVVNHPDCNLCTECLGSCPHDNTLGLNGSTRFNWLPALITVAFIMTGIILGTKISIPTIDMKWGTDEQMERSAMYEMAGLKNVKCYGSSVSFVNQMKTIPGITGAATFVRDHRVQVMYDSTQLSPKDVRRKLFTSAYIPLRNPDNDSVVRVTDLYVENFFDPMDLMFLSNLCESTNGIYSFQTAYGEPVKIRFYHDGSSVMDSMKSKIENLNLIYATSEENFSSKGLYQVVKVDMTGQTLTGFSLKKQTFPSYKKTFNNRSKYSNEELGNLVFPLEVYPKDQQMMPYLVNHLGKANSKIVGLVSEYSKTGPVTVIFYVKGGVNPEEIVKLMMMEKLSLSYDNGVQEEIDNPFTFGIPENLTRDSEQTANQK